MIALAERHAEYALGFQDETWWSRVTQPNLHAWVEEGEALRLIEQTPPKNSPDPKALACYGLLVSCPADPESLPEQVWLRFVDGRPISSITIQYLAWCCEQLVQAQGVRIVPCFLPIKSPWLNRIEPHWVHGKRSIVEPASLLTAQELADRVCAHFDSSHEPHLTATEKVT